MHIAIFPAFHRRLCHKKFQANGRYRQAWKLRIILIWEGNRRQEEQAPPPWGLRAYAAIRTEPEQLWPTPSFNFLTISDSSFCYPRIYPYMLSIVCIYCVYSRVCKDYAVSSEILRCLETVSFRLEWSTMTQGEELSHAGRGFIWGFSSRLSHSTLCLCLSVGAGVAQ